jgi:hypothetical protein
MNRSVLGLAIVACATAVAALASSRGAASYSPAPSVTRSAAKVEQGGS